MDAFRGIAALSVLVGHCVGAYTHNWKANWEVHLLYGGPVHLYAPFWNMGQVGVALFFFISGFLLYISFGKAWADGRAAPSTASFYKRRFRRIAPAYYASLAILLVLNWAGAVGHEHAPRSVGDVFLHLSFLHNLTPESVSTINGVYWTLAPEAQFYLVLPFIASWFHGKRRFVALFAIITASGLYRVFMSRFAMSHGLGDISHIITPFNFSLIWRLDQFAVGMFFAGLWLESGCAGTANAVPSKSRLNGVFAVVSLALVVVLCLLLDDPAGWLAGSNPVIMSLAFGGLIIGTVGSGPVVKKIIANPLLQFAGIISYSIYLWHMVIVIELNRYFPARTEPGLGKLACFTASGLVLSVAAGLASYLMFERPFLKKVRRAASAP